MKKLLLAICAVGLLLTGCGSNNVQKKWIVGLDDAYPPMGFRDEQGELVGFDIDLAKEAAKSLGVEVEFKPIDWDDKIVELKSGNIDMIWNGLDITPERMKDILYSKPYLDNRQILLVKKGNNQVIRSLKDLTGKVVGTQGGSNSEMYIIQNSELQDSFADFKIYRTVQDAFAGLASGEVDVLICDELAARYDIIQTPDRFEIIYLTIGSATEIGIGFRKDDIKLRNEVQKAFDKIVADGTARKISEKWFHADLIK